MQGQNDKAEPWWQQLLALVIGMAIAVVIVMWLAYHLLGLGNVVVQPQSREAVPLEIEAKFPPLGSNRHIEMEIGQQVIIEELAGHRGRVTCVFVGWSDEQHSRARLTRCLQNF